MAKREITIRQYRYSTEFDLFLGEKLLIAGGDFNLGDLKGLLEKLGYKVRVRRERR